MASDPPRDGENEAAGDGETQPYGARRRGARQGRGEATLQAQERQPPTARAAAGRGRQAGSHRGGARGGGGRGGGQAELDVAPMVGGEAPPRAPAAAAGGGSGRSRSQVTCHVFGCGEVINFADAGVKRSNLRYRICQNHMRAEVIAASDGALQRWCHKCSRLHDLSAFSQGRRTCAKVLKSLVARRRTVAADGRGVPQAPGSGGAAAAAPRRQQPKQQRQVAAPQQLPVGAMQYPFSMPGYMPSMTGLPMMHGGGMLGMGPGVGPPMWQVPPQPAMPPPGGAMGGGDTAPAGLHLHLMASALSSYAQWLMTQQRPGEGGTAPAPGPGPGPPHVAGLVNMPLQMPLVLPPVLPPVPAPVPPVPAPPAAGQQGEPPMPLQQWLLSQVADSSPPAAPR